MEHNLRGTVDVEIMADVTLDIDFDFDDSEGGDLETELLGAIRDAVYSVANVDYLSSVVVSGQSLEHEVTGGRFDPEDIVGADA